MHRKFISMLFVFAFLVVAFNAGPLPGVVAQTQRDDGTVQFDQGSEQALWYLDEEIEHSWVPGYLDLATGDPNLITDHGVYDWPFALDSIGWSMQSYQDYGGTPYFHHGMDMMKIYGTNVINQSGGQVVNIENYNPGWDLYWEVAVLDPYGYIWQYHHIQMETIPQYIWDKYAEWQADPDNGGFIPANTHIGNIIEWPVWSFGKQFNHIHLNILAAGGVYVNGFEFHNPLPDTVGPEIQAVGLVQNGQIYPGNTVEGDYSLYVRARDLILDDVYYLPPWEITFSVDGGPVQTTWRFDTLPGGASDTAYLNDFYLVPPTCGDYECRDYYIDLGFIPDSQFVFPMSGGQHTVMVTVSDYAGSSASQTFTYTVIGPPPGTLVWQDDFETDLGWVPNPDGTDTATSGQWERGNPEDTSSGGPKQLGTTPSGLNDLVTGRLAGATANSYDIDGGVTSIRSPGIALPADSELTLSFRYYLAHGSNSSSADILRVSVVVSDTLAVFEEIGAANNDNGAWAIENVSLNSYAGQTVYLLIEAADNSGDSLVEAAIDNVLIVTPDLNQAPIADPQSVTTPEDTAVSILLTGSDPDSDPLTFAIVSNPTHGSLSGTAPDLTYTPFANSFGPDSFTFHVNDGQVSSEPAMVSIDVTAVNDAPVADPQSVSTPEDSTVDILLTSSDPEGDLITYTVISSPTSGTLSGEAPNLSYSPDTNFVGPDSFTFHVTDGQVDSAPATVSIAVTPVNDAPEANAQTVSTAEDMPHDILLTGSDIDGDSLTYAILISPTHGSLSGTAPNLTYMPAQDYSGSDSFSFSVNDGHVSSEPATVSIELTAVNDAPVADLLSLSTPEDSPLDLVLTGSDVENDALTFTIISSPTHGTLEGVGSNLSYTPQANSNGADSFTFSVNDGQLNSEPAMVSIEVMPVNDTPVADPQSVSTVEDVPLAILLSGSDLDGDALNFILVSNPAHGSLSGTAPNLLYTPANGYAGADYISFVVNDGQVNSELGVVTIHVTANDAPVANPQYVSTAAGMPLNIVLTGWDLNGDPLTYRVVSAPEHGTLTGTAPNLTYTPATGYSGMDSFAFVVNDGILDSATGTISIRINQLIYWPIILR